MECKHEKVTRKSNYRESWYQCMNKECNEVLYASDVVIMSKEWRELEREAIEKGRALSRQIVIDIDAGGRAIRGTKYLKDAWQEFIVASNNLTKGENNVL